jgi:hypothetical protein
MSLVLAGQTIRKTVRRRWVTGDDTGSVVAVGSRHPIGGHTEVIG